MRYYYAFRCWIKKPACFWIYPDGEINWWYARCKHCALRKEQHE